MKIFNFIFCAGSACIVISKFVNKRLDKNNMYVIYQLAESDNVSTTLYDGI